MLPPCARGAYWAYSVPAIGVVTHRTCLIPSVVYTRNQAVTGYTRTSELPGLFWRKTTDEALALSLGQGLEQVVGQTFHG
jgi:hypothetical protein